MKKIALVLSALVMCAALISCASKKEETVEQPAEQSVETAAPAEETAVPVQQSGAWQENSMSNTAQCGYFFTSRELGPLGTVEAVFKKTAATNTADSVLHSATNLLPAATFRILSGLI